MEVDELLEGEEFVSIRDYPGYYISNQGRCYNSNTKRLIGFRQKGYIRVTLKNENGERNFRVHRLVMEHFGSPQPDGNYEIDHINHQRDDNRIENLRWTTRSDNNKNRSSTRDINYGYFDEIPVENVEDIIDVREYGNHEFEDLYYADGYFYFDTGVSFRRLHINFDKRGSAFVSVIDVNGIATSIRYSKFKKLYGLN